MQKQAYTKMGRQELRADIIANLPEEKNLDKSLFNRLSYPY
jgi:hypothetical protein